MGGAWSQHERDARKARNMTDMPPPAQAVPCDTCAEPFDPQAANALVTCPKCAHNGLLGDDVDRLVRQLHQLSLPEGLHLELIRTSNGRSIEIDTYRAAVDRCLVEWPNAEIGHDGDLTSGGVRTLVWESEADSTDDDGARAIASIVLVVSAEDLRSLAREAAWAGDYKQVDLCKRALDGDADAIACCARVIDYARAQS